MASECTSRGLKLHDLYADFNSAYRSCSFSPREVHSDVISAHFYIYLGLGTYGGGVCLHSLHNSKMDEQQYGAEATTQLAHVPDKEC